MLLTDRRATAKSPIELLYVADIKKLQWPVAKCTQLTCSNELTVGTIACWEKGPQESAKPKLASEHSRNKQLNTSCEREGKAGKVHPSSSGETQQTHDCNERNRGEDKSNTEFLHMSRCYGAKTSRPTWRPKSENDLHSPKRNCEFKFVEKYDYTIGGTGEPLTLLMGQKVRSTRLLERDLVRGKRFYTKAEGKEPKQMDAVKAAAISHFIGKESFIEVPERTDLGQRNQTSSPNQKSLEKRLQALWHLSTKEAKADGLWKILGNINLWCAAYRKLAQSQGSMTHGGARGTIDGTSLKTLRTLRDQVIGGKYQYGLTRRVNIPKPKGGERPLGIPEFRDRLVQECTRTILECLFEPQFLETSHGFRPGRSQHSCLRQVRRDFVGTTWYIEGDISKCYDTIDHSVVMKLLGQKIKDRKFLNLVERGLRTKVLLPDKTKHWLEVGTPQGGVCSPLISNIVLHELDKFVTKLRNIISRGKSRKQSREYMQIYNQIKKSDPEEKEKLRVKARLAGYGKTMDETFLRCSYVRYADDFLIGISGPLKLAERVRKLVARFLTHKLKLKLSEEKTVITHAKSNKVPFLGYLISHGQPKAYMYKRRYQGKVRKIKAYRGGTIRLQVDFKRIVAGLRRRRLCNGSGKPIANFPNLQYPQSHTVNQVTAVVRGIGNYYILANDFRQQMSKTAYIVRQSLAMMFAAKYKLRTRAKVFAIAGKDLSRAIKKPDRTPVGKTDEEVRKDAKKAGGMIETRVQGIPYSKYREIPLPDLKPLARNWTPKDRREGFIPYVLTRLHLGVRGRIGFENAVCAACGSSEYIEMHHVRKVSDIKGATFIQRQMQAANRKAIPLCNNCHKREHGKKCTTTRSSKRRPV